jgi:hypothetical protein
MEHLLMGAEMGRRSGRAEQVIAFARCDGDEQAAEMKSGRIHLKKELTFAAGRGTLLVNWCYQITI